MKTNLAKMDECKTANDYLKVANGFERIAAAERQMAALLLCVL